MEPCWIAWSMGTIHGAIAGAVIVAVACWWRGKGDDS